MERHRPSPATTRLAIGCIEDGWSLLIYPEGGRSEDGWVTRFEAGGAYLAARTGTPVVPVHVEGPGRIWPKGASRITPGRTTITFGRPITPPSTRDARDFAERYVDPAELPGSVHEAAPAATAFRTF